MNFRHNSNSLFLQISLMTLKLLYIIRYNECERELIHMTNNKQQKKPQPLHPEYVKKQQKKARGEKKQFHIVRNRLAVMLGLFVVIIATLGYSWHEQKQTLEQKEQQRVAVEQELKDQKQQKEDLENEIKQLNDDEYISQLAREKLFLSKKGEVIFTLPKDDGDKD